MLNQATNDMTISCLKLNDASTSKNGTAISQGLVACLKPPSQSEWDLKERQVAEETDRQY